MSVVGSHFIKTLRQVPVMLLQNRSLAQAFALQLSNFFRAAILESNGDPLLVIFC